MQPNPAAGAIDRGEKVLNLGDNRRQSGWVASIQTRRMAKPTRADARAAVGIWCDIKDNVVRSVGITAHTSHAFQMIQSQDLPGTPGNKVIGAGGVTTHAQPAHDRLSTIIQGEPAAEHIDAAD